MQTDRQSSENAFKNTCVPLSPSSMLSMSSPKAFILGLPVTAMILWQVVVKVVLVHVLFRCVKRIAFWFLQSLAVETSCKTPCEIMPSCSRVRTTDIASISSMNRMRKLSRTCSPVAKGTNHCIIMSHKRTKHIMTTLHSLTYRKQTGLLEINISHKMSHFKSQFKCLLEQSQVTMPTKLLRYYRERIIALWNRGANVPVIVRMLHEAGRNTTGAAVHRRIFCWEQDRPL